MKCVIVPVFCVRYASQNKTKTNQTKQGEEEEELSFLRLQRASVHPVPVQVLSSQPLSRVKLLKLNDEVYYFWIPTQVGLTYSCIVIYFLKEKMKCK